MKRFTWTTAVLLLFFLAGCNPSKGPEATAPSGSPAVGAPITASPNQVPAGEGNGTTTISWNTGDGSWAQVYVAVDGGSEALFASAPQGSAAAPWIETGKTFEFRLYAGTEHTKLLAKTQVTRQK